MLDMAKQMLGAFAAVFERGALPSARVRWEVPLLALLLVASAIVRFWGLGNVGLHEPDEDTVALPAMHLVQHGEPLFPSGMYYARAIVQTYLIAGSINVFGNSESALRLPSAICGVLVVLLAYFVGRRFFQPALNLAFVAAVAFLPELIMQSQNARMYIFLVACIAAYLVCIFAWERSNRAIYFVGALLAMLLGLQFHSLMIFTVLLLLYPGLLQAEPRKFWIGAMAMTLCIVGYAVVHYWGTNYYPVTDTDEIARVLGIPGGALPEHMAGRAHVPSALLLAAVAVAAAAAALVWRQVENHWGCVTAGVLVFLGMMAQFLLNYHVAAVLLAASIVIALRNQMRARYPLWIVGAICVVTAVAHVIWLNLQDIGSRGVIFAAMMGKASIWSFLNYVPVSYGATVLAALGAGLALLRVAQGRRIPKVWLFVLLGVWAPLFVIGFFSSYPEQRYMTPVLLPLLIAAFATVQWILDSWGNRATHGVRPWMRVLVPVLGVVLVVNPFRVAAVVNPGYDIYPDHNGAARYLKSLPLQPGDIVVAEDAIMQTYYLGTVDYWLTSAGDAVNFGHVVNGEVHDIYADARIIVTPQQLESVLDDQSGGDVYVVGTGEGFVNGRPWQRGPEIDEMLAKLEVVYAGRDGLTRVWKRPSARR